MSTITTEINLSISQNQPMQTTPRHAFEGTNNQQDKGDKSYIDIIKEFLNIRTPTYITKNGTPIYQEKVTRTPEEVIENKTKPEMISQARGLEKLIKNNIRFDNISKNEIDKIIGSITQLYLGSQEARRMFDSLSRYSTKLYFRHDRSDSTNKNGSQRIREGKEINYVIYIDFPSLEKTNFKNTKDEYVFVNLSRYLAHECCHLINGTDDSHDNKYNPTGETVDFTNDVMKELGGTDQRKNYPDTILIP